MWVFVRLRVLFEGNKAVTDGFGNSIPELFMTLKSLFYELAFSLTLFPSLNI